jgi:hypothetical protein
LPSRLILIASPLRRHSPRRMSAAYWSTRLVATERLWSLRCSHFSAISGVTVTMRACTSVTGPAPLAVAAVMRRHLR